MILSLHSNTSPKCKVATFIRLPIVPARKCFDTSISLTVREHVVSDLFIYEYDDYKEFFYITGDVIRFSNHNAGKYRNMSITILFDYKSKVYNLLCLDPQKYIGSPNMFIKTPNGNLYVVLNHFSHKTDNLYREVEYRLFTVNNLTQGKAVFRYEEEKPRNWMFIEGERAFPTFSYTNPLYNSFIIIIRVDTHNKLEKTCLYIVDLVKDAVEEVAYDLKSYVRKYIDHFVRHIKENYGIIVEVDSIFSNSHIAFKRFISPNVSISAQGLIPDSDYKLINYRNKVPIYSQCKSTFLLQMESTTPYRTMHQNNVQEIKLSCSLIIQFFAYIENNELNILLTCKKVQIHTSIADYDVSSNDILLHEKYLIDKKYNIEESRLYSIDAFLSDYLIKNRDIYRWVGDSYKLEYELSNANISISKRKGIYFININNKFVLAIVWPKLLKENQSYLKVGSNWIVDLTRVKETINKHGEEDRQVFVIDVTGYINDLSIKDLVYHIVSKLQNRVTNCEIITHKSYITYKSYINAESGILYLFMILQCVIKKSKKIKDWVTSKYFVIAENNIKASPSLSRIVFLSNPYSSTFAISRTLLSEIINKISNQEDRSIYFLDFLKHLNSVSKGENEILYLYDGEIMVRHKIFIKEIIHVISTMEFKDVRYNRKVKLQCEGGIHIVINSANEIKVRMDTKRYDSIMIHGFDIRIVTGAIGKVLTEKVFKYNAAVVFSSLNLVHAIRIKIYN
jgi:hypothetical protein